MKPKEVFCEVRVEISVAQVESLLVSALEGGSNYWYRIENSKLPKGCQYWHEVAFGTVGLSISDHMANDKPRRGRVTPETMKKGLELMAREYSQAWSAVINDDADASTGDIFLQLCLFGEVIYG